MLTDRCFVVGPEVPHRGMFGLNHDNLSGEDAEADTATTVPSCWRGKVNAIRRNQTLDFSPDFDRYDCPARLIAVSTTKIYLKHRKMSIKDKQGI